MSGGASPPRGTKVYHNHGGAVFCSVSSRLCYLLYGFTPEHPPRQKSEIYNTVSVVLGQPVPDLVQAGHSATAVAAARDRLANTRPCARLPRLAGVHLFVLSEAGFDSLPWHEF